MKTSNQEFRAFLDMLMCSDTWPVKDGGENMKLVKNFANLESRRRGFDDWLDAYHRHETTALGKKSWKPWMKWCGICIKETIECECLK